MKKIMILVLTIAMVLSLAACGAKKAEEPAKEAGPVQTEADSSFAADFTDKLYAIQQNYHNGTAGSSLKAAALAAEIMDIFKEANPSVELVAGCLKEFAETLTGEAAAEYPEQLAAIAGAAEQLCSENGKGLLEDCGYNGTGYPWDAEQMTKLFGAMIIK